MRYIISLIFLFPFLSFTQEKPDIVRVSGEAEIQWFDNESKEEAYNRAEELATINALEKAFGKVVVQGNSTLIRNENTGREAETTSIFNMIGNTYVKGEVIEVIKKDFKEQEYKERKKLFKKVITTYITCKITVKAKEIKDTKVKITAFPLGCADKHCKTTQFYNNDDFFLYFSSPESGYISVFLDDNKYTYRLLPYKNMPKGLESNMPVIADKEYIFFSDKTEHNYFEDNYFEEDTYQLVAETDQDLNRLFIIFSKNPVNKPSLRENLNPKLLENVDDNLYSLPKALESEDFQHWLIKNRYIRDDIQVEIVDITITRK